MDPAELLRVCVPVFERSSIGYFVTGSIASGVYGEVRFTRDIDIVVHLGGADIEVIVACFPESEFYVSPDAVREAINRASQFNVLHPASGLKLDFMVSAMGEFDRSRFARTRTAELAPGLEVRLASPEDVILKKLEYFRAGGSDKHIRDIAGVLRFQGESVDAVYIQRWVERLGLTEQWDLARARTREEDAS